MSEPEHPASSKHESWWSGFRHRLHHHDAEQIRILSKTTPFLWVWLLLMLLAAYQVYGDPLGFSSLTQRYSQDLINLTLTGPLYPTTGQSKVSVALIDDGTLSALHMDWPWPYGNHARILDALLAYHPRAVAVDILFLDARDDPSLAALTTVIDRYKRAKVPLYFVGSPTTPTVVRPELAASGVTIVDPTIVFNQGLARQYPTAVKCLDPPHPGICPSWSLRIYNDVFANGVPARAVPDPNNHIEIVWGVSANPINRKWMRVQDDDGNVGPCPPDVGIARRIWRGIIDVSSLRSLCPYTGIIPAEALLRGDDDPDLDTLITDRVVFYGAKLQGSVDLAFTPTNGLLPAVFVHAMALDNLVSFHGAAKQDVVGWFGFTETSNTADMLSIGLILLVLTTFHIARARALASESPTHRKLHPVHRLAWYGILLFMVIGTGTILYVIAGLSIGNWIVLVFTAGALFELEISPFLARLWGRLRYIIHI